VGRSARSAHRSLGRRRAVAADYDAVTGLERGRDARAPTDWGEDNVNASHRFMPAGALSLGVFRCEPAADRNRRVR
jgi:hypothetical protein